MATIGSIGIAFTAETGGLLDGVTEAVSSLRSVEEAVESLRRNLSSLSASVAIDSTEITKASDSIKTLQKSAKASQVEASVSVDSSEVDTAAKSLDDLVERVEDSDKKLSAIAAGIEEFAKSAAEALSRSGDEALEGAKAYASARDAVLSLGDAAESVLGGISNAAAASRAAVQGVSQAFDSLSSGRGAASTADASVVAAGRIVTAYQSVAELLRSTIPNAVAAGGAALGTLASTMGGLSTIMAAASGSTAAAAIAVGSLAGAVASGVTAVATYAGVMAIARAATAGMSEEAQQYAMAAAQVAAVSASAAAAAQAGSAAYRVVATALFSSASASQFFTKVFSESVAAIQSAIGPAGRLVSLLGVVASGLQVMSAASTKTASGFAGVVAQVTVTTAATGALVGAVTAAAGGTSIMAGAATGAVASLGSLASSFPVVAAGAIALAVATGRVSQQLKGLAASAGQLGDLSDRFGQPVQEMEKLRIAASNTNTAFTAVVKGQQNFANNLEKVKIGQLGTPQAREAAAAFSRLGITVEDLRTKSPETVFLDVAREVSKIPDATKRTQVAMDLFGKTGPLLMPLLKNIEAINADMERLGGTIATADFERLTTLDRSFQRVETSAQALSRTLLIPFTRMQQAVNNLSAEISGGLVKALSPVGRVLADISTPIAVIVEIAARMANVILRVVGVFAELLSTLGVFATVAVIFEGIKIGFESAMAPVEDLLTGIEAVSKAIATFLAPAVSGIGLIGKAIGLVVGGLGQLVTYIALGAAAWGIYSAAVAVATGFSITATVSFIAMWAAALGPFAIIIAGLAAIGAGITLLISGITSLVGWMFDWGDSAKQIDGATASVDDFAAAVAESESASLKKSVEEGMIAAGEAAGEAVDRVGEAVGLSEEQVESFKQSLSQVAIAAAEVVGLDLSGVEVESTGFERARETIAAARGEMEDFSIRAARLGQAGAEAIAASSEEFNELQRNLANGSISLEEFEQGYDKISENLGKTLDSIEQGSPEQTLQKNLELFKQLDDAAKQVAKSVRDIGAGVQIGDKFFPRSAEVKARAQEYADQYTAALEDIKKKLASGGFQQELDARSAENERAFAAGEIDSQTFERTKRELDTTSAQEQAAIAAEDVQRELDRQNAQLKVDLDFADNIRKNLETAFLSPVELFQKELDKINANPELTDEEKGLAEQDLRKKAREQLIGKTAVEQFSDRERDISQGQAAGLITDEEAANEIKKNADALAKALGIPVNPANQMEIAVSELDAALKAGKISVEQHADGLKAAQRSFLESLGIKPAAEELDAERLAELEKQRSAKKITDEQFEQGRQSIENDILGQSAADRMAEQRRRIESGMRSGAVGGARGAAALRAIDADRRSAAGLDDSPSQQIQLGVDKINDAFGTAGLTIEEVQKKLSPEQFAEYQEAMKKNRERVLESLGVQKAGIVTLNELKSKLADAGATAAETAQAMRKANENFMQSLGIEQTPFEKFSSSLDNIAEQFDMAGVPIDQVRERLKGNAEQLALFDRAVKTARDNLLSSLGIEKSPQQVFEETMARIDEARNATDPNKRITGDQAVQAEIEARRRRDEALGAGDNATIFGADFVKQQKAIEEAFGKGGEKDPEKFALAMEKLRQSIPGAEPSSPLVEFRNQLAKLEEVRSVIGEDAFQQNRLGLQAQLQEDLKPAIDSTAQDRRLVGASDVRSKEGVDTFFRILQGRDNPSLKAQLEIARNTRLLAEAAADPEAAPVIAQLNAR